MKSKPSLVPLDIGLVEQHENPHYQKAYGLGCRGNRG
jgi:hypothetical protein